LFNKWFGNGNKIIGGIQMFRLCDDDEYEEDEEERD
jgi:hypothetical protein